MTGPRITNRFRAGIEHESKDGAGVVRRASDDEVVGGVPPCLTQPFDVGFEPSCREDDGSSTHLRGLASDAHRHRPASIVREIKGRHVRVVRNVHARALRGGVVAVHQRFAATQEEQVRA